MVYSNAIASTFEFVSWPYLELDSQGRVRITETKIRISLLVQQKQAHGWSPEELHFQYPILSLAQIHSALSYYYAHKPEIDQEIAAENQQILQLKAEFRTLKTGYDAVEFKAKLQSKIEED